MTVDRTPYLVSREVMALYEDETNHVDKPFISLNTPTEFRVTVEAQPVEEIIVRADPDGTYSVLRIRQSPRNRPPAPYTAWRTNDLRAAEIEVLLCAGWLQIGVAPASWVSPYMGSSWDDRPDIPGVTIIGQHRRIEWNEGRSWAVEELAHGVVTPLYGLPPWLPFTPQQILESQDYPPGSVGLVPRVKWQTVPVEEALELDARVLERMRTIRQERLLRFQ